jgi:hypothetical protein
VGRRRGAVAASTDPLIVYARSLDANARALQKRFDAECDAPLTAARARLADARFAAFGDSNYPDATFTLRISYGKVEAGRRMAGRSRPVPCWAALSTARPEPSRSTSPGFAPTRRRSTSKPSTIS